MKVKNLPWLPTDDFMRQSDVLSTELKTFLKYLLFVTSEDHTAKVQRIVSSLAGTEYLQSSYKGATEKDHSVCFQ